MLYIAIVHDVNSEPNREFSEAGYARLSYGDFEKTVRLSRAKIAAGLKILETLGIVKINREEKTSVYQLVGYNPKEKWAKLPYRHFYHDGCIKVFGEFHLRKKTELNALKIYLLLVAFRDNDSNFAIITYEKIRHYTGILENDIRSALSLLVNMNLVHVDRASEVMEVEQSWTMKTKNMYRIIGLRGRHLGNTSDDDLKHYLAEPNRSE
jgi:hypothetical protein